MESVLTAFAVSRVLQVIFRYALALFKYKEDDFLKIHDSVEIYHYLRFFTKTVCDSRLALTFAPAESIRPSM